MSQTKEEQIQILKDYFINHFAADFPHLEPIFDANGQVICGPSYASLLHVLPAIPHLTAGLLKAKVAELATYNMLVRKPPVVERIIEIERKPTADELAKDKKRKFEEAHAAGFLNSPKHNRNELDRDDDHKPPVLTEPQKQALNAKNERDNQIIADVQSRISNYTGATHSRTYAGRDALKQTFVDAMNKGLPAEQVQKAVEAKLDSLAGNSSAR